MHCGVSFVLVEAAYRNAYLTQAMIISGYEILNVPTLQFDFLAQRHGVQKIDVIGDAYLAATNVMEDQVFGPVLALFCA